jgi:hypothetical protein
VFILDGILDLATYTVRAATVEEKIVAQKLNIVTDPNDLIDMQDEPNFNV